MASFTGGQTVKGGYFVNTHDIKLEMVPPPWGMLPGDSGISYRRVPVAAMLVLAPLLGLSFVLLLPFIGIAVVVEKAWRQLTTLVRHAPVPRTSTVHPR